MTQAYGVAADRDARPVVVFDMSGVVFVNGTRNLMKQLANETGVPAAELQSLFMGPDSWQLRRGEITADEFWTRFDRVSTALPIGPSATLRLRWLEAFVPHHGMLDLLRDLASVGHLPGTIAETTAERADALHRRYGHERRLGFRCYSFEQGVDKRDGGLFARAAATLCPTRRTVIMVEDDEASAAFARTAGFHTILFAGAAPLRRDLQRLGLLPESPEQTPK